MPETSGPTTPETGSTSADAVGPGDPGLENDNADQQAGDITSQNRRSVTGISAPLKAFRLDAPFSVGNIVPKRSDLLNTVDRYLDRITEKKGRASLTVYEPSESGAFSPKYTTSNFFAEQVQIGLSESFSIVKNNRGYVLYAIDENPITISVSGSLLDGSEDAHAQTPVPRGAINDTDWFNHFLAAYQYKLRAAVAQAAGVRIFFSYNALVADVHLVDLKTLKTAINQNVVGFGLQMVVRTLTIFGPPDLEENKGLTRIPDKTSQRFVVGGDPRLPQSTQPAQTPGSTGFVNLPGTQTWGSTLPETNAGPVASDAPQGAAPVTTYGTTTAEFDFNNMLNRLFPLQATS